MKTATQPAKSYPRYYKHPDSNRIDCYDTAWGEGVMVYKGREGLYLFDLFVNGCHADTLVEGAFSA